MNSFIKKLKKLYLLGPARTKLILKSRVTTFFFTKKHRTRALTRTAHHTWKNIQKNHPGPADTFAELLADLRKKTFAPLPSSIIYSVKEEIIKNADNATAHRFAYLGSSIEQFKNIPWHTDIRLQQQSPSADISFDNRSFYKDITIKTGLVEIKKDIKLPWELARFGHAPLLGAAYQITQKTAYSKAFQELIDDWLTHNPYLLGIHWLCPMEVAIRAINWIWAFHFFKNDPSIGESFWERFCCSLYDHFIYLENNLEVYDSRTSNHYLSDLVGCWYLCAFFEELPGIKKKISWYHQTILAEIDKQIFFEGTDYEGSTTYHRLVTELIEHFCLVCQAQAIAIPKKLSEKINRMRRFTQICQATSNYYVTIGDNDSGTVLAPPLNHLIKKHASYAAAEKKPIAHTPSLHHFPAFGITCITSPHIHLTLRHHAYTHLQPVGHQHNDALSITLALNNIPIFVDPGSYLYSPSYMWRNRFRSACAHTLFFIENEEPVPFLADIFSLAIPTSPPIAAPHITKKETIITSHHALYSRFNLEAHRSIHMNNESHIITIKDSWRTHNPATPIPQTVASCWNFTLHPEIDVQLDQTSCVCSYKNRPLLHIEASLAICLKSGIFSPAYGHKQETTCITAQTSLSTNTPHTFKLTAL